MRAVVLSRHGGPEVLNICDVPVPEPRRGEVRVRVRFIGVNFAEVLSRRGVYGWAPPLPYIPGMEAFGEIDAIGESVTSHRIGEPVLVGTQYGTYAEFVCVDAVCALPPPHGFTPQQNAAFAVNYLTAWIGLMEMARMRPGDTVLVTSAAGGVGSAAVQIASRAGATVIGAAGRGKQEIIRTLGANQAIDYDAVGWDSQLPPLHVILEMRGGAIYRAALRHIAPMGRVVIAGASEAFPRTRNPLTRLLSLRAFPWAWLPDMVRRSYGVMNFHIGWLLDAGAIDAQWRDLVAFTERHHITPLVGEEFDFDHIREAHRALEERRNIGKVVVRVA